VVTEPKQFGGSLQILRRVSEAVTVPVLRRTSPCPVRDRGIGEQARQRASDLATTPDPLASDLYRLSR
jgi:hypothetical protein